MRRLVGVSFVLGLVAGMISVVVAAPASASTFPPVSAEYRFLGSLAASEGNGAPLTDLTGCSDACPVPNPPNAWATATVDGLKRRIRTFSKDNGFALSGATDVFADNGGSYTIFLQFKLDTVNQWTRLIEFGDGTRDAGLYVTPGNHLAFLPYAETGAGTIAAGQWTAVEITRNNSTGSLAVYLAGVPQFTKKDAAGNGVVDASNTVHFFQDNTTGGTTEQDSSGAVGRITIYKGQIKANKLARFTDWGVPVPFIGVDAHRDPGDLALVAVYEYGVHEKLKFFFTDANATRTLLKTARSTQDGFIVTEVQIPSDAATGPGSIEVDGATTRYHIASDISIGE